LFNEIEVKCNIRAVASEAIFFVNKFEINQRESCVTHHEKVRLMTGRDGICACLFFLGGVARTSTTHSEALPLEDKSLAHKLYGLMACFPILLLPAALSLFINLNQRQNTLSSVLVSHLRWQRWSIICMLLFMLVGYLSNQPWLSATLYVAGAVWFSGRIFKGWLSLIEGRCI